MSFLQLNVHHKWQWITTAFLLFISLPKENSGVTFTSEGRLPQPQPSYINQAPHGQQGHVCCNCTKDHRQHQLNMNQQYVPQNVQGPHDRLTFPTGPSPIPNYLVPEFSDDRSAVVPSNTPGRQRPRPNFSNGQMNSNIYPVSPPVVSTTEAAPVNLDNVIHFKLLTRENPVQGDRLQVGNDILLKESKFSSSRQTKVILSGFADGTEDKIGDWVGSVKEAYLSVADFNIIAVDFSYIAGHLFFNTYLPLESSIKLADLIYFLNQNGAKFDDFHLIGRSWGAHIAGMTGRMLKGQIGRITGLEPAGPPEGTSHEFLLDFTDAKYVDIVRVNGKRYFFHGATFGLVPPTGHIDIYPNYVEKSMGCPDESNSLQLFSFRNCKNGRGVKYFVETIRYPFAHPICHCQSFNAYKNGQCTCGQPNTIVMGSINNQTLGVFQMAASPVDPTRGLGSRRYSPAIWG